MTCLCFISPMMCSYEEIRLAWSDQVPKVNCLGDKETINNANATEIGPFALSEMQFSIDSRSLPEQPSLSSVTKRGFLYNRKVEPIPYRSWDICHIPIKTLDWAVFESSPKNSQCIDFQTSIYLFWNIHSFLKMRIFLLNKTCSLLSCLNSLGTIAPCLDSIYRVPFAPLKW